MNEAKIASLIDRLGSDIIANFPETSEGTLLVARVYDKDVMNLGVYVGHKDKITGDLDVYETFSDTVLELWRCVPVAKQWEEMTLMVIDRKFSVTFTYPEDIDHDEFTTERRWRVVISHLGDKPIRYRPMHDDHRQL